MDIFGRLRNGDTIAPGDPEMYKLRESAHEMTEKILQVNNSSNPEEVVRILSAIIGKKLENFAVFTPIYINYGKHLNIGKNVFINYDCILLAMGGITIEDNVMIAPRVSLITESHPLDPNRRRGIAAKSICIKRNAWIGASATILPGVTVGVNSVVAAGAVVSKDVPDNTIVRGIPAKIIKRIDAKINKDA